MRIPLRILLSGLLMSGATSVLAQTASPSQTTGQNLDSAGSFRNIAPTGVTKPPGAAAAPDTRMSPDEGRKKGKTEGSGIKGICIGCN